MGLRRQIHRGHPGAAPVAADGPAGGLQRGTCRPSSGGVAPCAGTCAAALAGSALPGAAAAASGWHAGASRGDEAHFAFDSTDVSEEDIHMLDTMESMKTADAMLDVVSEHLSRLTTAMIAECLYRVARRPSAQLGLTQNPRLRPLLDKLWWEIPRLQTGARSLAQLVWSLGKLDTRANAHSPPLLPGMEECMLHICSMLPKMMAKCTPQDLTNALWGIARLFPGGASGAEGHVDQVSLVSRAIVRQCIQKVDVLTSQSIANSFWALARLKFYGPDVEQYMRLAMDQTGTAAQLESFTPQGLANVLWALAQLRTAGVGQGPQDNNSVQLTLIAMAEASAGRLLEFQTQELSMVAWSYAKLYVKKGRALLRPAAVEDLLLRLAAVATTQIDKFEDQGISNIAWSLATLDLTGAAPALAPARGFIEAATAHCATELGGYSAQAVANLMWACVRTDFSGPGGGRWSTMERFCSAVVEDMKLRMSSMAANGLAANWRDLSGVAVALSHWGQKSRQRTQSMMTFMSLLTHKAAEGVARGELTPQLMLNIAQSAARLHAPPEDMQQLVDAIDACVVARGLRLNELDARQWGEVQRWCPPHRPGSGDAQHQWAHGGGYSAWPSQPPVPYGQQRE
ncbi:unnamed protein product, partial [Prorocentrum cordatum]